MQALPPMLKGDPISSDAAPGALEKTPAEVSAIAAKTNAFGPITGERMHKLLFVHYTTSVPLFLPRSWRGLGIGCGREKCRLCPKKRQLQPFWGIVT
jgi:hypothetical protein